ncbi:hypothetical protein CHLNCDRAFT_28318, partial [Chlorella variabilis]
GRSGSSGIGSGIKLENVAITFKNQQVLRDISWDVKKGERVGLVGVNGAGKTTQLQVRRHPELPGRRWLPLHPPPLLLPPAVQALVRALQAPNFNEFADKVRRPTASGTAVVLRVIQPCMQSALRRRLVLRVTIFSPVLRSGLLNTAATKSATMMPELGFGPDDNDRLVASYSGGWQMRMCLGKILLKDPDLLLLDEPTNHLDLDAIEWLEGYLKKQEIPMVIVSHDREFLDQLCTKIVETERGVAHTFKGNYTEYVKQKEERNAQQWVAWEKQQKEIGRQEEMMRRLAAGANSGRASTAEKALERLKAEGTYVEKPFVPKKRAFFFPPVETMGQVAVRIEGLTHGYGGDHLFEEADLTIEKGERVAIIGPNGAGKSTLLRLLMGREEAQEGTVELGSYGVVPNYFEQNQAQALDLNLTVIETLVRAAPDAKLNEIKGLLGKMLFSGTGMEKKVEWLSGGEKARLALAKFMLTQGTLLVLDEPTNHLDIPSKETLEEAVRAFEGSVIAVSHDRYFLRRIATRIVTVQGGKLVDYQGDYELFLEQNKEEAEKMAEKEEKAREIEKSTIKAKSKMSKAEKAKTKKEKAKSFNQSAGSGKVAKNAKRWN